MRKMNLLFAKNVVHVEVCLNKNKGNVNYEALELCLKEYINSNLPKPIPLNVCLPVKSETDLLDSVDSILMECAAKHDDKQFVEENDLQHLNFHIYRPYWREMELEMFDNEGASGDAEAVPSSSHWILPSAGFVGLWENLVYEQGLKDKLLKYALSALTFSQHNVNQNVISCNRLILLHGPPGTGKTSLCKAIAQKLSIRTRSSYRHTHLIEINSHSLFSKWFSESGKLVMRLFVKIREIIADPHNLVCVLIDEVESLAYARNCMSGQEPKDAMRVVNALLTQLDSIKENPNVLILATSNLADTIDMAFLDRADIKQFIGMPGVKAIKSIYESMLLEIMRVGIVRRESLKDDEKHEDLLTTLAERSIGLSGRTLRKLPFLAHAVQSANVQFGLEDGILLCDFLDALLVALEKHKLDQDLIRAETN